MNSLRIRQARRERKRMKIKKFFSNVTTVLLWVLVAYAIYSYIDIIIHNVSHEAAQHIWKYNFFNLLLR